jgi:hypothetical protein
MYTCGELTHSPSDGVCGRAGTGRPEVAESEAAKWPLRYKAQNKQPYSSAAKDGRFLILEIRDDCMPCQKVRPWMAAHLILVIWAIRDDCKN